MSHKRRVFKRIILSTLVFIIAIIGIFLHKHYLHKTPINPLKTENPQKRTIAQVINVSGLLAIKQYYEVGSLQPGIIKEVLVKPNQQVKKGQLFAIIDTGKDDTEYREAKYALEKSEKELVYQKQFYHRQKQLYESGQLSKNAFEEITKNYETKQADVKAAQATRDKRKMEYESTFIKSPTDGILLAVEATKGMLTTDTVNVKLFEVAEDPKNMEAVLEIDESDIGKLKEKMPVKMTTNSFPDRIMTGKVDELSFTPKTSQTSANGGALVPFYKAIVNISNADLSLRPGMIINARIKTQKAKDVISISGLAFQMDEETVKMTGKKFGYMVKTISKEELKKITELRKDKIIKLIWTVHDKQITQKAVTLGTTDNTYWQIIDGLTESDHVLLDIEESAELDDLYKKAAGGMF